MKEASFTMMEETQQAAPAYKTRSRTRFRSLTQEAMLAFVETAQLKSTPEILPGENYQYKYSTQSYMKKQGNE